MSDMAPNRITVRVTPKLGQQLRDQFRAKGQSPSEVVRVALEDYFDRNETGKSAYEMAKAAGLIGSVRRAPRDLSTNPRHFEGFGRGK